MQLAEVELCDIIERMIPSDRIIVESDGTEIYRGYVANIRKEKTEGTERLWIETSKKQESVEIKK